MKRTDTILTMDSRRDFIKKATLLALGGSASGFLPHSIQRALAIDPKQGTTWHDAEHVVILMQENRSFDHSYGSLQGVRGFNDPRAVTLPSGNPVWLQSNAEGETYAPFRLNIQDTKATWMGSLPHSWTDQVDARRDGKHDGWLEAKRSGHKEYSRMPLTLGYYSRADIPFYYALADAFTVCDQNFCSSLTGTTPNRLYLWTGTIREQPSIVSKANVRNEDVDYDVEAQWKTFPERLEEAGVSWRIYQNELSLPSGLTGEEDAWLSNFTDNPLEWFTQYQVRFAAFRRHQTARIKSLETQLASLEMQAQPWPDEVKKQTLGIREELNQIRREMAAWSETNFAKLPAWQQNLHRKAFTTNDGDPHYRELDTLTYKDGATERQMFVPKGDIFHQFRKDATDGNLPMVSWLVAPSNFSDHPGSPWYGAWYVSEALDILTQNPEVWKKTIFILCYDENDGYFDHVPPFTPPFPGKPETGKVSTGIDVAVEHVRWEQELERQKQKPGSDGRSGPIGLGFRVPLVIVSPWSRGGRVCSQVFDHTSILQFLEKFVTHKTGRAIRETNISNWRRAVCGDLTSVFQTYHGEKINLPSAVERNAFLNSIHRSQFKQNPKGFKKLEANDFAQIRSGSGAPMLPKQEQGIRPSCALPYELAVDGSISLDRKSFEIRFAAGKDLFGERSAGAPFHVYSPALTRVAGSEAQQFEAGRVWAYAVSAGDRLMDAYLLNEFKSGAYHLRVHGPNGFFREFLGSEGDPALKTTLEYDKTSASPAGDAVLCLCNQDKNRSLVVQVESLAYGNKQWTFNLNAKDETNSDVRFKLDLSGSFGWYDLRIRVKDERLFEQRYAGRIESGRERFSDPLMGGV